MFRDQYIPMRRYGEPIEVGPAVALLLSDKVSGYTTGADIVIDGGLQHHPVKVISDEEIRTLNTQ
jgi:NAD(P)-dependent dehydrogenase (short-subunit alcohol dehydrogenase family)